MQDKLFFLNSLVKYVFIRFQENKCSSVAAELTVTSLLALVPLTTVLFSLLSLFPSFQSLALPLQELMFEYFVPATGESVQNYLLEFVSKAKDMSGVGFIMLVITALLMMRSIDKSFNHIWQIKSKKTILRTFLVYWAVLTLGPIFLGTSLLITSYLKSLPMISDVVQQNSQWITVWLPMLMEFITFTLMYLIIPNRKILLKHAIAAAFIAAVFFEVAKFGFGVFVEYFSTYQIIFGALATIPLFLIWVYLSWSIILFGAEICHGLFSFQLGQKKQNIHPFIELLHILLVLSEKQLAGEEYSEKQLGERKRNGNKGANILCMERLVDSGLVAKLQNQSYCLKISCSEITYKAVYELANKQLPDLRAISKSSLPQPIQKKIGELSSKMEEILSEKISKTEV